MAPLAAVKKARKAKKPAATDYDEDEKVLKLTIVSRVDPEMSFEDTLFVEGLRATNNRTFEYFVRGLNS